MKLEKKNDELAKEKAEGHAPTDLTKPMLPENKGITALRKQLDILQANEPDTSREGDKYLDWVRNVEEVKSHIAAEEVADGLRVVDGISTRVAPAVHASSSQSMGPMLLHVDLNKTILAVDEVKMYGREEVIYLEEWKNEAFFP